MIVNFSASNEDGNRPTDITDSKKYTVIWNTMDYSTVIEKLENGGKVDVVVMCDYDTLEDGVIPLMYHPVYVANSYDCFFIDILVDSNPTFDSRVQSNLVRMRLLVGNDGIHNLKNFAM